MWWFECGGGGFGYFIFGVWERGGGGRARIHFVGVEKKCVDLGCRQVFVCLKIHVVYVHRFLDWIGQMECHRCLLSRKGKIKTHLLPALIPAVALVPCLQRVHAASL